jgi:isopenicillin-N epimerase
MFPHLKNQFFLDPEITFLNHGSFGACAKPIYNNLLEWQEKLEEEPVKFFENTIFEALEKSRQALGDYINCPADDLVYFQNPTTAVNAVARSLKLNPGDEVLSTNHIYGALDRSWKYILTNKRANFVKAKIPFPIQSKQEFLDSFFKHITNHTKVIFLSHITSMTAMKLPVEEVIEFAKEKNILTIIDGAHVPGHIPLNILKLDADIYTGACHKWMCTPKGVSFLYVRKELQKNVHPLVVSWGWESENPGHSKFLDWHEWQGTRDMSAFLTIPKAVEFLNNHNWLEVGKRCREEVVLTRNKFLEMLNILPPCPNSWLGQMASIPLLIKDADLLKKTLLKNYQIQVPVFKWEGNIYLRYSFQAYNTCADLDKLLSAIKEILI